MFAHDDIDSLHDLATCLHRSRVNPIHLMGHEIYIFPFESGHPVIIHQHSRTEGGVVGKHLRKEFGIVTHLGADDHLQHRPDTIVGATEEQRVVRTVRRSPVPAETDGG